MFILYFDNDNNNLLILQYSLNEDNVYFSTTNSDKYK